MIDFLGLKERWEIFFTGGEGNLVRYDDPFDDIDGDISRSQAANQAARSAKASRRFSNGSQLDVTAVLMATADPTIVVRRKGYEKVDVSGLVAATFRDFSDRAEESIELTANQETESIDVVVSPSDYSVGDRYRGGLSGPRLENPVGSAGLMLVKHDAAFRREVTVSFRGSGVVTHDDTAFPSGHGVRFTPTNITSIAWYTGGYQARYDNEDVTGPRNQGDLHHYDSASDQTAFGSVSLTFVLRCVED